MGNTGKMQKTIGRKGSLSGIGVHTGEKCTVIFRPAPAGSGIRFFKNGVRVPLEVVESFRCTSVGRGARLIKTVEHLLAALQGLEIHNIVMDVDGPEIPGLDGSADGFVKFLKGLGIRELTKKRESYGVTEPIFCYEKNKALAVYPADEFRVAYALDYDHPCLRDQKVDFVVTPQVFESEIAPARTFCTEAEAGLLRKQGLGLGANYENTLVISENGPVQNHFRYPDECARHKALDLLGDLNLLGFSLLGRVVGLRSGHALNQELVKGIKKQRASTQYGVSP